jgi:deoxyribonuclease V
VTTSIERPLPLSIPDLPAELRGLIRQIPRGRVATCGGLAEALGNVVAARWVGHFLQHHDHDPACPCHRVVLKGGVLGRFVAGTAAEKETLLADEGIDVSGGVIDLARFGWTDFRSPRPLEALKRVQEEVLARAVVSRRSRLPELVGGVDVSYPQPGIGVAAYALVDVASGELVWSHTVRHAVCFPYITSFLSFRELPPHMALLDEVRQAGRLADVVLVDGSGRLHPRHAGIATHLGVVADVSTIGVTKKLLCGQCAFQGLGPGESCPVVFDEQIVGVALRPTAGSARPIFISVGQRVNLGFAERLVRQLLGGRRLPAPLYWADRLSRLAGRKPA